MLRSAGFFVMKVKFFFKNFHNTHQAGGGGSHLIALSLKIARIISVLPSFAVREMKFLKK